MMRLGRQDYVATLGGKMLKMAGGANQSQGEKKRETGKGFSDSQTMSRPRNVLGLGEQTS